MSTQFFGQLPPPPRRHGAVARVGFGGAHEAYCPQCSATLSTWGTPMEAMSAAAYHNSQHRSDRGTASVGGHEELAHRGQVCAPLAFDWAIWMAMNVHTAEGDESQPWLY